MESSPLVLSNLTAALTPVLSTLRDPARVMLYRSGEKWRVSLSWLPCGELVAVTSANRESYPYSVAARLLTDAARR